MPEALQPFRADGYQFSGFHVPDKFSPQGSQGAGFACHHVPISQAPDRQRMETVLVPAGIQHAIGEDDDAEGTVQQVRGGNNVLHPAVRGVPYPYQVTEEFAVGR